MMSLRILEHPIASHQHMSRLFSHGAAVEDSTVVPGKLVIKC